MIFGDPAAFAVSIEPVDSWSNQSFHNGLMFCLAGNELLSQKVMYSTIDVDIGRWAECIEHIERQVVKAELEGMPCTEAFAELYRRTFAVGYEENDYMYLASTACQRDAGEMVFLLKTADQGERLIYGTNPKGLDAQEREMPSGQLVQCLKDIVKGWKSYVAEKSR